MKIKLTNRRALSHGSLQLKKDDVAEVPASVAELVLRNKWGVAVDDEAKKLADSLAKPEAK